MNLIKNWIHPETKMTETIFSSSTISGFVEDKAAFGKCVDIYFQILDVDKDGGLSEKEMREGLNRLVSLESEVQPEEEIDGIYKSIFEKFDVEKRGKINRQEFDLLMKEIMLAMADAFTSSPVIMFIHQDGWIMQAVQHELAATKK